MDGIRGVRTRGGCSGRGAKSVRTRGGHVRPGPHIVQDVQINEVTRGRGGRVVRTRGGHARPGPHIVQDVQINEVSRGRGGRVVRTRGGHARPGSHIVQDVQINEMTRGRGGGVVRTRGGHARPEPHIIQDVQINEVSRGCGGRGVRGTRGRVERPGPHTIQELQIQDASEYPVGQPLERPLQPKRRRMWQPSPDRVVTPPPTASTCCKSPSVSVPSPAKAMFKLSAPSTPRPVTPAYSSLPSSAVSPMPPVHLPCPNRSLRDEDLSDVNNFGSDEDSDDDDDDDEDELVASFVPRAIRERLQQMESDGEPEEPKEFVPVASPQTTATNEPRGFYDFNWRAFPNPPISPESRRETFSVINVGPTIPSVDPYDIFIAIWDRQFMEYIASETNRYAQEVAQNLVNDHKLHPHSRIGRWRDTTADELYVYLAIIITMGLLVKSRLDEYWNTTLDIFITPGFRAHMSYNRFKILQKCLHFNNNNDMCALKLDASEAKLFKIRPVLSHLSSKFESLYTPNQNISLDESLLQWKGWLSINQVIPNKTASIGIKTYEICESQTGYLYRFEIHAHKRSLPQQLEDPLNASTPTIVLRLTQGLENKGYTLWMDNFYNSPCLARRLKVLGFDCVGTLRTNNMFVPQALHSLTKALMRPGEISGLTSGDVDIMVWRDNNRVACISTYHGNGVQSHQGYTKPILILDYNIMMGGVDKKDQMLAMYPIERKRTRVWYKKLFRRLLNVSVLNSYIIHKHNSSRPLSHRNFRINLVRSLLSHHSSSALSSPSAPLKGSGRAKGATPFALPLPLSAPHRLAEYPMGTHQRQRRMCVVCKKRVHTFCAVCRKALCLATCFPQFHSM